MAKLRSSLLWLLVILAILSPVLWLVWRNHDRIDATVFGAAEPVPVAASGGERPPERITALGRIEPADGVVRLAGPARIVVVVRELLVSRGDLVERGQLVATVDSVAVEQAEVAQLRAELAHAELELQRAESLLQGASVPRSTVDRAKTERDMAEAKLQRALAELARSNVRSPISGRVLDIYAKPGEKVTDRGIIEIADTSEMLAVAEVYETDIARVRIGQRAKVRSPALPGGETTGTVSRIRQKISRRDVLDTDPVADAETRVVEVEITLDDPESVASVTNLRVDVTIDGSS